MIKSLHIQNYALIEDLKINFSEGLTIITGETGAGKSILLGALGLIMGDRAETKVLYNSEEKCSVEACFDIKSYDLKSYFETNDLDYDNELIIRREISPGGKSRAFVNDTPVNLKILDELSSSLIDLHQQFDLLDIHQVSFQLRLIDALAENKQLLKTYSQIYRNYIESYRRYETLKRSNESGTKEMDFVLFQLKELEGIGLSEGEQERLEQELSLLSNSEEIQRNLMEATHHLLESEQALLGQLEQMRHSLVQIKKYDARLAPVNERFDVAYYELQDLAKEFVRIADSIEYDPERLLEVQQRLDAIYRLLKKHQAGDEKELLAIQATLQQKVEAYTNMDERLATLTESLQKMEKELTIMAVELRERRKMVIPGFEEEVKAMLATLAMENAQLKVELLEAAQLGPTGKDEAQFLFAANKGSRLMPIKDVASGGEMSRLTLVTKSLVASAIPLPTLIFDEIDAGVSGDVSLKMGLILRRLSNQHQVVVITHSPQVASKADAHYFVYKREKDDRTITHVRLLDHEERIKAIATMLSQNPPSESAMQNARELMEN